MSEIKGRCGVLGHGQQRAIWHVAETIGDEICQCGTHPAGTQISETEEEALRRRVASLEAENERLRVQGVTDGLWVNPDVLVALLDVYEAAAANAEQLRSFIERHEAVYGTTCAALRQIADAVDRARPR